MDTEILLAGKMCQDDVGKRAKADLDGCVVIDDLRYVETYPSGYVVVRGSHRMILEDGLVVEDKTVDFIDVNVAVSPGFRHVGVHLGDHQGRVGHACPGYVHRDAETAIAVPVRWTDLDQGNVDTDYFPVKKPWDLGEIGGDIVDLSLKSGLAHFPADEKEFQRKPVEKGWVVNV